MAKEIWEIYLKEACDQPREAVLEIQKCAERLGRLSKEISEMKATDKEIIEHENKMEEVKFFIARLYFLADKHIEKNT